MRLLFAVICLCVAFFLGSTETDWSTTFQKSANTQESKETIRSRELLQLAKRGNVAAQFALGERYRKGVGISVSHIESEKWYTRAAVAGHSEAQGKLHSILVAEIYGPKNQKAALKRFTPNAKQGGAFFQYLLGEFHRRGPVDIHDHETAFNWYLRAANQGFADAQTKLGMMHERGEGVPQNYDKAFKWFKIAADQGLSANYIRMSKLEKNDHPALAFWKIIAAFGSAEAKVNIGTMYFIGDGVFQNYANALRWYKLAAEHAAIGAQEKLGKMYKYGLGTDKNYSLAHMWYGFAAAQGSKEAAKNKSLIANSMNSFQIAESQKLADECIRKKYKEC